jgi:hypothetical protein
MGFYKINFGNVDDEYGIVFYNQDANNLNFFISQVNNAIQDNLKSLINNGNLNTISTFHWVESCEDNLVNLGYESVNLESYYFDFSIDEENNIELFTDSVKITNNNSNNNGITLYEIGLFSEFHTDITFNSYFLSNNITNNEFDFVIKDFLEQNVNKMNIKMEAFSELLASYMSEKGLERTTPEEYSIYCDHRDKLPNQWIDVLGEELYNEICNRNELPQNVQINLNNDLELPL